MNTDPYGGGLAVGQPRKCRIRAQGRIVSDWADRFEGLTITTTPAAQARSVTTLAGILPDQAALVGVINTLHDLRLPVLSVECQEYLLVEDSTEPVTAHVIDP